jgi:hypothetical protein
MSRTSVYRPTPDNVLQCIKSRAGPEGTQCGKGAGYSKLFDHLVSLREQ